jgi:4-hydroxybenzoyl-CoA thioesterase
MIPVDWKSLFEPTHTRPGGPGSDHASHFSNTRAVRIDWGDCDPAGIIFYPRYFDIFDGSTSALFERALGLTKIELLKAYHFSGFPLVHTQARFLQPTRFGDDVMVESKIKFGHTSFEVDHRLSLKGVTCVECVEKRVWVVREQDGRLKPQRVPEEVIRKFWMI